MEIAQLTDRVHAFIRPDQGANVGLIRTDEGAVVIDTTSCATDMQTLLDAAGVSVPEVRLVINTHLHGDHTWGNQLFNCPIVAHHLCREQMAANLDGPWTKQAIEASIAEREAADPAGAQKMRAQIAGLRITLPTQTFVEQHEVTIGSAPIQVIHTGGHSPGSSVVWLPEDEVLFSGDLLFIGRYPYMGDADVPVLLAALRRLLAFGARTIVPGHGPLCGEVEVRNLHSYLQDTWERTIDHLAQGHSADQAAADPGYPRYGEQDALRREANIRAMYTQLTGGNACPL